MRNPEKRGHIYCPKDVSFEPPDKGEPVWKMMALPFRLKGKMCKKCGEPDANHIIVIESKTP